MQNESFLFLILFLAGVLSLAEEQSDSSSVKKVGIHDCESQHESHKRDYLLNPYLQNIHYFHCYLPTTLDILLSVKAHLSSNGVLFSEATFFFFEMLHVAVGRGCFWRG